MAGAELGDLADAAGHRVLVAVGAGLVVVHRAQAGGDVFLLLEDGLFGREEIEIIKPAIDAAVGEGFSVTGPIGADIMFHKKGFDAFVVMLHDQGHIPAKLLAENATAAMTIGTPILFASVAHGSAHDIAGKGVASAEATIEAIRQLTNY